VENQTQQSTSTEQRRKSLTAPLVALALPFALIPAYWWFVFHYASDSICTPRIGKEHQGVHLFFFWIMTFFPFSAVCFFSSVVMLNHRKGQDPRAKGFSVLAWLCAGGAIGLFLLLMFA
jgi:hypothetical protein